jgi:hypothetical protein
MDFPGKAPDADTRCIGASGAAASRAREDVRAAPLMSAFYDRAIRAPVSYVEGNEDR